jgi:Concanavalin A-like lectin/glucanases superfamily
MKPERLACLIHSHLDGALTAEEAQELSAELVANGAARRTFWEYSALHGLMPEAVHLAWLSGATPQYAEKIVPLPIQAQPKRWPGILRSVGLAAAACFLVAGGYWSSSQNWWPWRDRSVATLMRAPEAIWETRGQISRDARLLPGRYRLNAGAAEIRFRSGARLIVEAPAEVELANNNTARLLMGQASGFVPPEARGFTVITPSLTLVDLGTAFGLKVPPAGPAEAHVFEGEVSVNSDAGGTRSLFRGEGIKVTDSGFADIPSRPEDFLSAEGLAARESVLARKHLSAWRMMSERLSRDPATLVHFTCEGQDRYDTTLRNEAVSRHADAHTAMIIGANRCEGRWPGKSGIAFRQPGDRVRFEVPGRYKNLTLFASVCLEALPHEFNALLMTENHGIGDLRWQFFQEGSLALALRTGPASDDRRFETVKTKPIITEAMLGRWVVLATVLDTEAGTVAHYVDGEVVEQGTFERKSEAQLNAMELGNWGIQLDDPRWTWTKVGGPAFYDRHFVGRIDQFALLSRVMTPEEIRAHSQVSGAEK